MNAIQSTIKENSQLPSVQKIIDRYNFSADTRKIIEEERLLPEGLLARLHMSYPQHSGLGETKSFLFNDQKHYSGLTGFRKVIDILKENGIDIGFIKERELFIEVYRFLATKHVLNAINWDDYQTNSLFQLVFPQPKMIEESTVNLYVNASSVEERSKIVDDYSEKTNPHDGNQQLNKPWFENENGNVEFLDGSQHKYPQCQLIFDKTTQSCFAFCTYCFRHAQVRGDEDMFIQREIKQIHDYLKIHTEVTDLLITGGDGGYMPANRLEQYVTPLITNPDLLHIRTVRLASRSLTFHPEMIISSKYNKMLELFDKLHENGIQMAWMAHFSTPRELLNPATIAAIRRLQAHGVVIRSQSPMMNHISLFEDDNGKVDIDRSAQNWIDLANIFSTLMIGFHSMYCARPTGEHHYYTAPLADMEKIFSKIYRSLSSINRPSRHISMTSSAGKVTLIGTTDLNGEKLFALKFVEARNMEWMDKVFLAKYDEQENTVELLKPHDRSNYFYEEELKEIETSLSDALKNRMAE